MTRSHFHKTAALLMIFAGFIPIAGCSKEKPEEPYPRQKTEYGDNQRVFRFEDRHCELNFQAQFGTEAFSPEQRDSLAGRIPAADFATPKKVYEALAGEAGDRAGSEETIKAFAGRLAGDFDSITRFEVIDVRSDGESVTFFVNVIQVISTFLDPQKAKIYYAGSVSGM
jgi:hypothetical protein